MTSTSATNPAANSTEIFVTGHTSFPTNVLAIYPGLGVCKQVKRAPHPMGPGKHLTFITLESLSGRGSVELSHYSKSIMRLPTEDEIKAAVQRIHSPTAVRSKQDLMEREQLIALADQVLQNTPMGLATALRDMRKLAPTLTTNDTLNDKWLKARERMAEIIQHATGCTHDEALLRIDTPPAAPKPAPVTGARATGKQMPEGWTMPTAETLRAAAAKRVAKATGGGSEPRIPAPAPKPKPPEAEFVVPLIDAAIIKETAGLVAPNSHVVYSGQGLFRVVGVETTSLAGLAFDVVRLVDEYSRSTVMLPLKKVKQSLRAMPDAEEIDKAFTIIGMRAKAQRGISSRWLNEQSSKVKSFDPISLAEVVRDLRPSEEGAAMGYTNRLIMDEAVLALTRMHAFAHKVTRDDSIAALLKRAYGTRSGDVKPADRPEAMETAVTEPANDPR